MQLELKGITKRFPGVIANDHVDLIVRAGEVHGLLGENGAGKSTLMNVLYGLYTADEGEIVIDGEVRQLRDPGDAIAAGIGMVHQHFMLIPVFTVAENIVLGVEQTGRLGKLDRARAADEVRELAERSGLPVDPDAMVEDLSVGVQQRVEILKALYRDARLLILDEPTAVLTPQEADDLFEAIRGFTAEGRSVVFISHKLREHRAIADRVSVLRRGRIVGTADPNTASEQDLANLMVGRPVELRVDKASAQPGETILQVRGLSVENADGKSVVDEVDLEVRRGEIVAIAGVEGNGQTPLVRAVTGLEPVASGDISVAGTVLAGLTRKEVLRTGVGHVPEDRGRDGLVGELSVAQNLILDLWDLAPFAKRQTLQFPVISEHARRLVDAYDIRTPSVSTPAGTLSGGNQQKVVVAREFDRPIDLLVAAQPTRGVDVGSIEYIHRQLVAKRDEGTAVLLVSSELDEVLALADRVAVMFHGRLVGPFAMPVSKEAVGRLMAGADPDEVLQTGADDR
ncbi:ABC transporter ATP-binding protein [Nitriliruptor alkaliphilus]|uniref:ABC transporter ATP-binding protein n=1 Tax=Nitriliruptor alkaliphilus TaxID=427918 RepID=UPI0006966571|nr:ABC transporter ATP-binding protein [Nitriliruptor alkaliphilus]